MASSLLRPANSSSLPASFLQTPQIIAPALAPGLCAPAPNAAPPSAFFGGFEPWLDFRVRAGFERARGSFAGRAARLIRAIPLQTDELGDGLWALCDGEREPLAFLNGGREGSRWARAGASLLGADAQEGPHGDAIYPNEDSLVAQLDYKIRQAVAANGPAPFDTLIQADGPLRHARCYEQPALFGPNLPLQGFMESSALSEPESLEDAWTRLLSEPPGQAAERPIWRELAGEKRVSMTLRVRALTTLSALDKDPQWEGETNLWGQRERDDSSFWLIEAEGRRSFLLERSLSQSPYHDTDELIKTEIITANGRYLWSSVLNINETIIEKENFFSRLVNDLPTPKGQGFDFFPGAPALIELEDVFEKDIANLLLVFSGEPERDNNSEARDALLAIIEAAELSASCSPRAKPALSKLKSL